jgi:hypothetical protein
MTMRKPRLAGLAQIAKRFPSSEPSPSFSYDSYSIAFSAIFYFSYDFVHERDIATESQIRNSCIYIFYEPAFWESFIIYT